MADRIAVNTFPNAKALIAWAGVERGIFAEAGLEVALELTENSRAQREGLAAGRSNLIHTALDNAVAMLIAGNDVVILAGGDSGMNELMVQPDVRDWADIRGRWLAADAPDTAYALQAKQILARHGLKDGIDYETKAVGNGGLRYKAMLGDRRYAVGVLNLPFNVEGAVRGLKSMGRTVDLLGPYQAVGAFAMRPWAEANRPLVERYLRSFVRAQRWALDPANRDQSIEILRAHLGLQSDIAQRTLDLLADPRFGYSPDARLDATGFDNMLTLRGQTHGPLAPEQRRRIDRAVDPTYYEKAMAGL